MAFELSTGATQESSRAIKQFNMFTEIIMKTKEKIATAKREIVKTNRTNFQNLRTKQNATVNRRYLIERLDHDIYCPTLFLSLS